MSTEELLNLIDTLEASKKNAKLALYYQIDDRLKNLRAEIERRKKAANPPSTR